MKPLLIAIGGAVSVCIGRMRLHPAAADSEPVSGVLVVVLPPAGQLKNIPSSIKIKPATHSMACQ